TLTFDTLKDAVAGSSAAFRLTLKLEAVSPKVFPPTYEGGKYAQEHRYIPGYKYTDPETGREGPVPCVLLDSVPSQANPKELDLLSTGYATPLLKYAPHCLVFGMWDSTGPRGGLGVKFARAIVSEVIGVNAVAGKKTSSRIDPLNIRVNAGVLYQGKNGGWT